MKKLTKTGVRVENEVNLKTFFHMAEKPTGHGPSLRDALAGLGMSVLASQASAEAPSQLDDAQLHTVAAVTDCVADGKEFRKAWLKERALEQEVSRSELKGWLTQTMKSDEFKTAMSERINGCNIRNAEIESAELKIQLAALDEKIAAAREAFAEKGFDLSEAEDGAPILMRNGQLAATFVQKVSVRDDGSVSSSEWTLDFSPLEDYRAELNEQISANRAEADANRAATERIQTERELLQQQIEDIWTEIEDRALGKLAELSVEDETERIDG